MTRSLAIPLCFLLLIAPLAVAPGQVGGQELPKSVVAAEQARIAAIQKATRAAVSVFVPGGRGGGSGVVITPDGYALTNFHVVKPAGNYMKCSMPDGQLYDAVIVSIDPTGDVALIKLLGRDDFPTATIADSDKVKVGDWCFAVGNPFLLATDFQPTVTWGLVSGTHRYQYPAGTLLEYADCIQTDASINPGNSGGPLFDANGDLIGINGRGSFEKRGRVNVGVGYAISINQINNFLGYLRSGRIVDHATLGATVASREDGAVVVSNILESSDAYRRGLRYGDEVISFGGRPIRTVNGFKNVLGIYPRGWRVPLSFVQDGERFDVFVRLTGVHSRNELIAKVQGKAPSADPHRPKGNDPEQPDEDDSEEAPEDGDQPEKQEPKPADPKEDKPKDDKPKDDKEAPKPGDNKKPTPIPLERLKRGGPAPMPAHVKKLFEARPGYTNYYFNQLNQDRIWNNFNAHGDFTGLTGTWKLSGETATGEAVEIELGEKLATLDVAGKKHTADLTQDLDKQLEPAGSGGLLAALHIWQRMLTGAPKRFGEVYYLGTAPLPGREELVDVLIGTYNVAETHFLFDPTSGDLLAVEMFAATDLDPCQIRFGDYHEQAGRRVPQQLEIFHGDTLFAKYKINSLTLPPAAEK